MANTVAGLIAIIFWGEIKRAGALRVLAACKHWALDIGNWLGACGCNTDGKIDS
jgi:hypothetical protein